MSDKPESDDKVDFYEANKVSNELPEDNRDPHDLFESDAKELFYKNAKSIILEQMDAAETLAAHFGYSHIDIGKPYRDMLAELAEDYGFEEVIDV